MAPQQYICEAKDRKGSTDPAGRYTRIDISSIQSLNKHIYARRETTCASLLVRQTERRMNPTRRSGYDDRDTCG